MRIPLTKYGMPQVAIFPAAVLILMGVVWLVGFRRMPDWAVLSIEIVLLVVLGWVFSFFRDPHRRIPEGEHLLVSPADGVISEIAELEDDPVVGGPAYRVSIFLSIFNVHINRVPCAVRVDRITYKEGQFRNAMVPESAQVNESNRLDLTRLAEPRDRLVVRQISGAIARRIVCPVREGDELAAGEQFGMIKFGSRTELIFPRREDVVCVAKVGDSVKAGISVLARYTGGRADE